MLDDPSYISQGTLCFAYESKNQSLRSCRYCKRTRNKKIAAVRINTAIRIYNQFFKLRSSLFITQFFTFNSAAKCETRGVIVSWLTSKGMFSLFIAFEGVHISFWAGANEPDSQVQPR